MTTAALLLVACLIDLALGWPDALFRRVGHPVTWAGGAIAAAERALNTGTPRRRHAAGLLTVTLIAGAATGAGWAAQALLPGGWAGALLGGVLAWPLVALRAMADHVRAVQAPLARGDLPAARAAVAMIVGRDVTRADPPAVARATLESLAENTADGIVAPVFWGVVGGLPGLAAYKAINTLDSMIGHRSARYAAFGAPAARIDDLVNLVPARLTGLAFALVSGQAWTVVRAMWRDAPHHRSPNAGWPEAAMAAALGCRLSGPRAYGTAVADEPWLYADGRDPGAADIARGLALYWRAMGGLLALLAALALV